MSNKWLHSRVASVLICATTATVVMAPGCSASEEDVTYENPVRPEDSDDTAPPLPAGIPDESLAFTARDGLPANHSARRFRFDVAAYHDDAERTRAETLYPSHAAALRANGGVPSVQTVGTYVKQLDDTIYAGVERAAQDGVGKALAPKRDILTGALAYLVQHRSTAGDDALVHVAAALRLGGQEPAVPAELVARVEGARNEFLASESESKPFGFYTWSNELKQIWQQDRLLQRPLVSNGASCALAEAIAADPARRKAYVALTELYTKLTNPLYSSLVPMLDQASSPACSGLGRQAFLSRSMTPEVALFRQLYPDGVPADADLMADLVKAIRAGSVDLAPKQGDGWYQHQLFALETLLVTDKSEERAKVAFMARYKKRLREAFSTMLVQHRETHAKQADETVDVSYAPIPLPDPRVEPMATVYVRHARSYVFLESALDAVLGPAALDAASSVDAAGPTNETLRARIRRARDLFFGLYVVACQDLGLTIALSAPGDPARDTWKKLAASADAWLLGLKDDALATSDVRVIVPIASLGAGRTKYWAVVGVRGTLAGYSFIEGMDVSPPPADHQARVMLPTEQFLEVESSATPMTREEFRKLCDENKTADAIRAALQAR